MSALVSLIITGPTSCQMPTSGHLTNYYRLLELITTALKENQELGSNCI